MKSISILATLCLVLWSAACDAQRVKNAKIENIKINGNCGMCKNTIEKAGNIKKVADVNWNEDTQMAVITYDSTKTNRDEILKRIALAGYDSDAFLAPDDAYNNLPGCCRYERNKKTSKAAKKEDHSMHNMGMAGMQPEAKEDHSMHNHDMATTKSAAMEDPMHNHDMATAKTMATEDHSMHNHSETASMQETSQLKTVFDNYFGIKDALVKSDGASAAARAIELSNAIAAVKMESLSSAEHTTWMAVKDKLKSDAGHISSTKDIAHQRNSFAMLSANMYALMQVAKQESPVYYQHCPMYNEGKGANWLSREKTIQNPYYGSQMPGCGKTTAIIQ